MPKVDLSNYEGGREHTYVKHYLLEKYLSRWANRKNFLVEEGLYRSDQPQTSKL